MATQPPIKTTPEDLDALAAYLRNKVGWSEIEDVKKRIPSKHADNRKIEAMKYIGLLDRDSGNIKLSDVGRQYAVADPTGKAAIIRERLRRVPLYETTLEWIHHHGHEIVTKADIANYWHDHLSDESGGVTGAALTDAAVFFSRLVGLADLGKFVAAGRGRDTELRVDRPALAEYVTGDKPAEPIEAEVERDLPNPTPPPPPAPPPRIDTGLKVNVEIHIAADATPSTIEEIFKNMRKYLMDQPDPANGG